MYPLLSLVIVVVSRVTCVSCGLDRQIRIRMGKGTWECKYSKRRPPLPSIGSILQ